MATQSFHPRLIINDHFNEVINRIDVITETLLENQTLSEEHRKQLNKLRERQIEYIKEIEETSLKNLPVPFDEIKYVQKWSHVLNDQTLNHEQKLDLIKEEIINYDCVLMEQQNVINGLDLWITTGFYNKKSLEFLK